jgi:hypothetical protein
MFAAMSSRLCACRRDGHDGRHAYSPRPGARHVCARQVRSERLDPFDLDQIGIIAHTVNESHGLIVGPPRSQMLQHRQDRPDSSPSGKEQDRPSWRAKVEATERAVENEPVTRLGLRLDSRNFSGLARKVQI